MKTSYYIRRAALLLVGVVVAVAAVAERPTIRGSFSKESLEVGDRVDYIIDIEKDRATEIGIPDFDGNPTKEEVDRERMAKRSMSTYETYDEDIFELVEDYPLDTVEVDGRRLHLRKRYRLAVMETGEIPMRPSILYFEKNRDVPDTLYADDTLRLVVKSYAELDTTLFLKADPTSNEGFGVDSELAAKMLRDEGIHSQKDLPFIFAEIRDYVAYGAITLILLALLVWLLVWYIRRTLSRREAIVKPGPKIPPHVVAIKALVELKNRKLWQNGKYKHYYTALTDILRVYIGGRWGIGAMEMTTDEIIAALRDVELPLESRSNLVSIMRTANMVKFAKAEPAAEDNEDNYTKAYYFVENTKMVMENGIEGKEEITINTNIEE
ncbi:MAG: hypothetical protein IKJ38_06065 [Alistipes sp.]|nr:hypothetical protein [Alistipes sp.]